MRVGHVRMFERVVATAEVTEVVDSGLPALRVIVIVVDLAAVHRHAAPGEPAMLVARTEEPSHPLGRRVGVGLDHHAGRVEEQAAPAGVATREVAGDVGVKWAVSVEFRNLVVGAGERCRRDGDLDTGLDAVEAVAVRDAGVCGEEEIREEVGFRLRPRSRVGGEVLDLGVGGERVAPVLGITPSSSRSNAGSSSERSSGLMPSTSSNHQGIGTRSRSLRARTTSRVIRFSLSEIAVAIHSGAPP